MKNVTIYMIAPALRFPPYGVAQDVSRGLIVVYCPISTEDIYKIN